MPKEYTLIGGNGTRVSPLEVTEDGDYFAGDSRAFNPVKVRAGGGGSSTLSGLTDVDISNPTDGQTLVYNAESGKWENGAGGGDMFVTLGTITADTVPMTYDEKKQMWVGNITTDITPTGEEMCAGRNLALKINGQLYTVGVVMPNVAVGIDETANAEMYFAVQADAPIYLMLNYYESDAPVITDLGMEVYAPIPELEVFLSGGPR